jgi:hypothetical protein
MSEYKNPILDAMIEIKKGNFDKRFNQYLYPITRWNSGCDKYGKFLNFESTYIINKYLFVVPQKMTMSYMYCSYKLHNMRGQPALFLKYPKKSENVKNEKYDVVCKYLKNIYDWSNNECNKNRTIINYYINDNNFIEWLDNYVGFEKKEKKLFGIKCNLKVIKNVIKDTQTNNTTKSLMDF